MILLRTDNILERLILNMMILEIFIFRWLDIMGAVSVLIFILICIAFLKYNIFFGEFASFAILGSVIMYNLLEYYFFGGELNVLMSNAYKIAKAFAIMTFIFLLYKYKRLFLISFIESKFFWFNFYIVLNVPITIIQILVGDFMVGTRHHIYKGFIPDFISGLFGIYGTPCMGVYLCFIFVINYAFWKNRKVKNALGFLIYNILILVYYFILFVINDNKGAYFMFVMTLLLVYMASANREMVFFNETTKFIYNSGSLIVGGAFVAFIVWVMNQFERINETFKQVIKMLEKAIKSTTYKSYGGAQRISIILQALRGKKRIFGYGLGNIVFKNRLAFGYENFGLADLGCFLIEGGTAYIILWIVLMFYIFQNIFKNIFVTISIICFLLVYAFYTQIFVDTSSFCSVMFLIISLEMIYNGNNVPVENEVYGENLIGENR